MVVRVNGISVIVSWYYIRSFMTVLFLVSWYRHLAYAVLPCLENKDSVTIKPLPDDVANVGSNVGPNI